MNNRNIFIVVPSLIFLIGLVGCVKQQVPNSLGLSRMLINDTVKKNRVEPGELAFFAFIQMLSAPQSDSTQVALMAAASKILPTSTLHTDKDLFGLELAYSDSIRLLYYEFSNEGSPKIVSYLASFSKGGRPLAFLPMKEASFNGYAAVNLVDQDILEMEYYGVYDKNGQQQQELAYEYYDILPDGQLEKLSQPDIKSEGRQYLEASFRLLSKEELKRYKASDLQTMEMELLAEYGHVFSDALWQNHFEDQVWYIARQKDTEHLLSGLEQVNLKNIREQQINW